MLDDVLGWLRCPNCDDSLRRAGGTLRCPAGHSFDIARQGYVSLLPPGPAAGRGDTAAMVAARQRFLAGGHFAPIASALAAAAGAPSETSPATTPRCVADVGAGTGYYLAAVLGELPDYAGLALDVSKPALRTAARAHPRIGAVGADAWRRLPVADAAADLVLDVFAPRDGAELRRILRPGGRLLVVTPRPDHLAELVGPLGLLTVDDRKAERLAGTLGPYFTTEREQLVRAPMSLDHQAVAALAAMGPSAWHADQDETGRRIAAGPDPVTVTLAVMLSVLRPAPLPRP
ncbi:MAG TPA: methyltransferase domain-containing protein [Streptosporangiaceae bacterium]